ncbi:hypothetical protein LINPERPRIM_LOCUS35590 [Linum perenne]
MEARKGAHPSWIWSSICEVRGLLDKGAIWVIDNMVSMRISKDPWLPSISRHKISVDLGLFDTTNEWIKGTPKKWDLYWWVSIVMKPNANRFRRVILALLIWKMSGNGSFLMIDIFSTRSAYHVAHSKRPNQRPLSRDL